MAVLTFDEAKALAFDPFQGDIDGGALLKDKIVTARKEAECNNCKSTVKPGDRVRSITERDYDELVTYRFCTACCVAMAEDEEGGLFDARNA